MLRLLQADSPEHWSVARTLFEEYAAALDFALDFQGFDHELDSLRDHYGAPDGCLLLATEGDEFVGCVALRRIGDSTCEMKRLYVKPSQRGSGAGRTLVRAIVEHARRLGYQTMRLDTVPSMKEARALYGTLGFRTIEPYRHNPIPGTSYMELSL